jgi:hypothetical protein
MLGSTRSFIVYCVVWAFTTSVSAATIRIEPSADNWISSCSSGCTTNNGGMDQLRVRTSWWGPQGSKEPKNFRSMLDFDLADLPGDSGLITDATLGLYYFNYGAAQGHTDPAGRTYDVHQVTNSWAEMKSTWQARDDYDQPSPVYWDGYNAGVPSYQPGGGDFAPIAHASAIVPSSTGNWMTWNVTQLVKDWVDGSADHGLIIKDSDEIESDPGGGNISYMAQFRSVEFSDPALWPYLEVTYIPEPGALLLLGTGFACLVGCRREKS